VSELLDEALADVDRGYALLPVDRHKRPAKDLIRKTHGHYGWAPLRHKLATEDHVRTWNELGATGFGVITGEPSRLAVVDVDDPAGAPELPPSAVAITRRGRHHYFECDRPTRSRTFSYGELKADGTYAVTPTSRVLGHQYRWEISPLEFGQLTSFERVEPLLTSICSTCYRGRETDSYVDGKPSTFKVSEFARRLVDFERSESVALRLAAALGVPGGVELGQGFHCLLHSETNPSASLWRADPSAHVLYRDWHGPKHGDPQWLSLAAVRARLAGRDGRLAVPELMVWKARLAHEAEYLEPIVFDLDARPSEPLERAWDGFLRLVGLRWRLEHGIPAPYSARFAAAWCGISVREAHESVTELARQGFLVLQGRDAHGCRLWLPKGVRPIT
jgi:hypothetical protein